MYVEMKKKDGLKLSLFWWHIHNHLLTFHFCVSGKEAPSIPQPTDPSPQTPQNEEGRHL